MLEDKPDPPTDIIRWIDTTVMLAITRSLSNKYIKCIVKSESAAEAWLIIKQKCKKQGLSVARRLELKIESTTLQQHRSLDSYLEQMEQIRDELDGAYEGDETKSKMTDKVFSVHVLNGLTGSPAYAFTKEALMEGSETALNNYDDGEDSG